MGKTIVSFWFQGLEIWRRASAVANSLFDIADRLEGRKLFRFADQVRGAAPPMPNNIAEGSGSTSDRDFAHFLNIARRSTFENASMMLMFEQRGLATKGERGALLPQLDALCRMLTAFSRTLKT